MYFITQTLPPLTITKTQTVTAEPTTLIQTSIEVIY